MCWWFIDISGAEHQADAYMFMVEMGYFDYGDYNITVNMSNFVR